MSLYWDGGARCWRQYAVYIHYGLPNDGGPGGTGRIRSRSLQHLTGPQQSATDTIMRARRRDPQGSSRVEPSTTVNSDVTVPHGRSSRPDDGADRRRV